VEGRPVVVSGSDDQTLRAWDLERGRQLAAPMRGHDGQVTAVAVGELQGRPVVVSGGHDHTVRVWDLERGSQIREPLRHEDWVHAVAIGVVGSRPVIVSGGDDMVRVWDLAGGAGHAIEVGSAALAVTLYPPRALLLIGAAMGLVAVQLPQPPRKL
jgi:WD40 repeat protein